jgi:tetratricopeptide (TPR) repeat protein
MAPSNGSNGSDDDFDEIVNDVLAESQEAMRIADAAKAAPDDLSTIAKALRAFEKIHDTESEGRREKLIQRALEIDPGCVEALVHYSQSLSEPTDASIVLEAAMEVGARRLGPEMFERNRGEFWDLVETRPYMQALYARAEAEMDSMDYGSGLALFQQFLDLSENDKLGVRFELTGSLLAADRVEDARKIAFDRYGFDEAPQLLWARTLILFLERDFDGATEMLAKAREENPHVESFLSGELELSEDSPPFYRPGSVEEAQVVARDLLLAWRVRPLALVWLKVGGKPGDDRYFGAYTDADLQDLFDEFADDDVDYDFDSEDDEDDEPYLLN